MRENSLYEKTLEFVEKSFGKRRTQGRPLHLERTAYWVKILNPTASEALLIAAVSHDIERAFMNAEHAQKHILEGAGFMDESHLSIHQEEGARIIKKFLDENGAETDLSNEVARLVSKHESGGDEDQNLLKDADSISFFENNVKSFLTKQTGRFGKKKVREKFGWMFDRISSEKAKEICKDWHKKAIEEIDKK
ncbi:MAG: DUF4202 family protein [archaeon]